MSALSKLFNFFPVDGLSTSFLDKSNPPQPEFARPSFKLESNEPGFGSIFSTARNVNWRRRMGLWSLGVSSSLPRLKKNLRSSWDAFTDWLKKKLIFENGCQNLNRWSSNTIATVVKNPKLFWKGNQLNRWLLKQPWLILSVLYQSHYVTVSPLMLILVPN